MNVVWSAVGILLLLWLLGFQFNVGGSLIHILVVIALFVLIYSLWTNRGPKS